jgi:hypothetical protein
MNPTADWEKLGERYYRKVQLYTEVFDQDLELENYIVTGAPYGGAIGMLFLAIIRSREFASATCKSSIHLTTSFRLLPVQILGRRASPIVH